MAEMTSRSETDKLSGLLNRRGFEDRARVVILNTRRLGRPLSAVVADLDHFKTINDTHGHEAGDRVITAFADVLTSAGNAPRLLSRMGGEEFAILMPGATLEAAQSYAEDVRSSFAALSIAALGPGQRFSASLGVTELGSSDSLSDLLRRADAALYEAKRGGRDRVCTMKSEPSVDRMAARPPHRKGSRRA
jgi:diguanylate cyclase (GGDEF)-like protein